MKNYMSSRVDISPYSTLPISYSYQPMEKFQAERMKHTPSEWRTQAVFQGLVALGFVLLGRSYIQNGWPLWLYISIGSAQEALKKHTQALSHYLALRKQND